MPRYRIENTRSGVDLGVYEATSKADALDRMSQDAGYRDYADCCGELGVSPNDGELIVTEEAAP